MCVCVFADDVADDENDDYDVTVTLLHLVFLPEELFYPHGDAFTANPNASLRWSVSPREPV